MFPSAGATVYRNEAGEPIGWDNHYADAPDVEDYLDAQARFETEHKPEQCSGRDLDYVDAHTGECSSCGREWPYEWEG
jgi:hypothetical protein